MMRAQNNVYVSVSGNNLQFWSYGDPTTSGEYFRLVDNQQNTYYDFMYLVYSNMFINAGLYNLISQVSLQPGRLYRIEYNIPLYFNIQVWGNNNPESVAFYFENSTDPTDRYNLTHMHFYKTQYSTYYNLSYPYSAGYSNWFDSSNLSDNISNYNVMMCIE